MSRAPFCKSDVGALQGSQSRLEDIEAIKILKARSGYYCQEEAS